MSKSTFYFKDIYPDFESFKNDIIDNLPYTLDDFNYNSNNALNDIYRRFMYEYGNSNVMYLTVGEFKQAFLNTFEINIDNFLERYKMSKELIKLSLENIKIQSEVISNTSDYTTTPVDVREAQDSYSVQNASFSKINELQAIIQKYNLLLSNGIKEFMKEFRFLFQFIFTDDLEIYDCEV